LQQVAQIFSLGGSGGFGRLGGYGVCWGCFDFLRNFLCDGCRWEVFGLSGFLHYVERFVLYCLRLILLWLHRLRFR